MKSLFTTALITLSVLHVVAQKPPIKFGDVTKEEVSMTTYDKDPIAEAVVLADYGLSWVSYRQNVGFTVDFERITRIKILTKDGLSWGNFEIPLYKNNTDREKITSVKAVTYNLEGGKVVESKLRNDGIFNEAYNENRDIVKVTCPNVREGSVVEISYKINSPYVGWLRDWTFQSTIPVVYSEYRTQIPEYYHFDRYTQGYVPLAINEHTQQPNSIKFTSFERSGTYNVQSTPNVSQVDYQDHKYRWVATDVPAFKPEPYMTSVHDYIGAINFELASLKYPNQPIKKILGTWEDLNKTLSEFESFGSVVTGNNFLKKVVEDVAGSATSPEEKIIAITTYVKNNVLWDGRKRLFASQSMRKVLDERKGHSADVNLLLASMLEKAGIDVQPVILSTRDNGLLRIATPVLGQFNYVIVLARAGERSLLLDATEPLLPVGVVPERCLNGKGLAISTAGPHWVDLDLHMKTRTVTAAQMVITPEGYLDGTLSVTCNGYEALRQRKKYLNEGEEKFVRDFVGSHQWNVKSTTVENARDIAANFIGTHELTVNDKIMSTGETLYLDPFLINNLPENPFKSEKREYPVDFGSPFDVTFSLRFTIPDGYVIDEMPESKVISMPENSARYIYNLAHQGNEIILTSMFQVNRSLFSQLDYPYLREFYSQIVAKQAEQIVLKRQD